MRAASALLLGALLAACTGSAPPEPPLEVPSGGVFEDLIRRAPFARVEVMVELTLDTRSCVFAHYDVRPPEGGPSIFVLIHPLRERCELWMGDMRAAPNPVEYCRFPREGLITLVRGPRPHGDPFRIDDPEHCLPTTTAAAAASEPENANARAATQAFTSNRDQLD